MKRLAALASFKLSLYLKTRVDSSFFKRYSHIISGDVTEEELLLYPEKPEELFFDVPDIAARYRKIYELCGGEPIALTAVQLYILAEMDGRTLTLLKEGLGLPMECLTIRTAARIALRSDEIIGYMPLLRRAYDRTELLLQASPGNFADAPFRIDGRFACWLAGDDRPDGAITGCTVFNPSEDAPHFIRLSNEVEKAAELAGNGFSFVHISGERMSGRRFFAREVARKLGREMLLVPYSSVSENHSLMAEPWRRVLRELLLTGRLLCLHDIPRPHDKSPDTLPMQMSIIERGLSAFKNPVFLTTDDTIRILPFVECFVQPVHIGACNIPESLKLWRVLAEELGMDPDGLPAEELAAKMTLTTGQIKRILSLMSRQQPEGPWDAKQIFRLCYRVLDDGRYQNIRFVDAHFGWDDLHLEPKQKETLRAICEQVENQGIVLDEWGLRRKFPYGRCVSALFSGPPGTGKSMAAMVLAGTLGLELYRVDLSQIVDKYIGETEKRLKQVFDQAEKSNLVLFFDEGDVLFGKRSEAKDAKDKYANTESAYLLQRMEEYSGVVLMATNLAGNIDSAFTRRFRYHVSFTLPGEEMRRVLWKDVLTEDVPQDGIRFDYLARQFELPGSQIKNIALNACYRAAADGGVVRMKHLVEAVFQERKKEGHVMLVSEFGEYGSLLYDFLG